MSDGVRSKNCKFVFCLLLPFLSSSVSTAQSLMTVRHQEHRDISPPLRDMIATAPQQPLVFHEAEPVRRIPLPPGLVPLPEDPVRQQTAAAISAFAPVVSLNFEGLGNGQYGFSVTGAPPDTEGTVGATQYVHWVNTSFAVFNKTSGALIAGPTAGNTLWSGFGGGCQNNNDGDPIVLYDKAAQRWIFSQFSVSTSPFLQCIAVSTSSDATGTYNRYSFQYNNFDDYPKMGVWTDAYYETFNMFDTNNNFVGSNACAYDRTAMLAGNAAAQVCFQQGTSVGGLLPSDIDGSTAPPAGSPNYMVFFGTNNLNLFKFHVDFATPTNSTFTGPAVISVAAFTPLCGGGTCVPQPGTNNQLDSLADRLMYRLAYRNFGTHESLVVNHSVVAGSGSGVRWYEIQNPSGTPTVAQQSTFAPDSSYRWMGSIAMDRSGDMALGYSISSSSVNPSIAITGRLATDPANTMQAETNVVSGTGSQTGTLSRWGDYSAMQIDPADDCTFWYTQEYIKSNGTFNWNTRITSFKFSNCVAGVATTTASTVSASQVNAGTSVTFTANVTPASGTATPTGTVTFTSGATVLGPATLSGGNATISTSSLAAGSYSFAATYSGDATFAGSTSATATSLTVVDFTVTPPQTSLTVTRGVGNTTSLTITPIPLAGFNPTVTFACSGLPSEATCTFSPTSVTPNGAAASTSVTINAKAPVAMLEPGFGRARVFYAVFLPAMIGFLFLSNNKKTRLAGSVRVLSLVGILALSTLWWTACGGSKAPSDPGTPVGTSTVTVTATSSGTSPITKQVAITLTVQ